MCSRTGSRGGRNGTGALPGYSRQQGPNSCTASGDCFQRYHHAACCNETQPQEHSKRHPSVCPGVWVSDKKKKLAVSWAKNQRQKLGEPEVTRPVAQFEEQMATAQPPTWCQVHWLWRTWEWHQRMFFQWKYQSYFKTDTPVEHTLSFPEPPSAGGRASHPVTIGNGRAAHPVCPPFLTWLSGATGWHKALSNPPRCITAPLLCFLLNKLWRKSVIDISEAVEDTLFPCLLLHVSMNSTKLQCSESRFSRATLFFFFLIEASGSH